MAEVIRVDRLSQPVLLVSSVVFINIIVGFAFGESPFLTVLAGLITVLAVNLLWRPGEPMTLLLLAALHLLQVSTALVYANWSSVHINSLSEYGVDIEYATWVALGGVLCLILGMSLGNAGPAFWSSDVAQEEAGTWSPRSAFRVFIVTLAIEALFSELSTLSEGVRQFFLAGAGIQWIGMFLLAYICLSQKRGLGYLLIAVGIEVAIGFTGFFSGFKNVFFVLFVAFAAARPKLNLGSIVAIVCTAVVALLLSAFWSDIKKDYREYLNNHSESQVVLVPLEDRLTFLIDRVSNADADTVTRGFDLMVRRISYVEFFGAVLNFVPASRPHEHGTMTMAAASHIAFPRLFFPNKAPLPLDTAVTAAYTGLPMELRPGVSISIGYPGEFYIDFGVFGMMACMGILGFFYGKAYRYVQQHFSSALVAYGATITLFMPAFYFETSLPKVIGGVCTSFIILLVMSKFVMPFALNALAWKSQRSGLPIP